MVAKSISILVLICSSTLVACSQGRDREDARRGSDALANDLAGLQGSQPTPSATLPAAPPPQPTHNYEEVQGETYYYVAALSDADREAGKAAPQVLGFRYLGQNPRGEHIIVRVLDSGYPASHAYCSNPCRIIRYENGSRVAFTTNSIIGAAFDDAINGRLVIAGASARRQPAPSIQQAPPVPMPPPSLPPNDPPLYEPPDQAENLTDNYRAM